MGHTASALKDLKAALGDTPYPFDHRRDDAALGHYVVNARLSRNDPQATFELGASALDRCFGLVTRIMISLALFAETIDLACALPLLPKYEEESEASTD